MSFNLMRILHSGRKHLYPITWLSRYRHDKTKVAWQTPDPGWTKLNFDGSFREKTGVASIGGAFRNHKAEFLLGYSEQIGRTTCTVAELSALYRGLEIVLENGWENVWVEGDPKTLVEIIVNRRKVRCQHAHRLVRDINLIMPELNNCILTHIYREGNKVADMLARMAHDSKHPRMWRQDPPEEIVGIIRTDKEGKGILRNIKSK
ncbi:hypothetical protein ACHQM5_005080 [Ranunculus cassubicifolius]